jgi:hypothetical protein
VVIKTFLLFFVLINTSYAKCQFDQTVISLSGPMTMLIEEMDLLKDPKLKGISKFHPIKKEFKGKTFAGGLFLSPKVFHQNKEAVIVFDKSREFKYLLKKSQHQNFLEVDSRDQDPFEVVNYLILKLRELTKGCRTPIKSLEKKMAKLKQELQKKRLKQKSIFFLGEIKKRKPELVISNDGFVMFLKKQNKLHSYPSEFAYVSWSQKVLEGLPDYHYYGLQTMGTDLLVEKKVDDRSSNLAFRGLLIPGIRQVYFLQEFFKLSSVSVQ